MDAPATSALSQTSAGSHISTTAAIILSGTSLVASLPVVTDAKVHSVSASASTTVNCAQTSPGTSYSSEKCD